MPLIDPKPPTPVVNAFKRGLEQMVQMDRAPAGLVAWMVQRVFVLTLSDVARGNVLDGVRPVLWRFVAGSRRGPAVAIAIPAPSRGRRPRMTSLETGGGIKKSFLEVETIKHLPDVRRRDYELRRLKLPGIIGVFWLAPQDDSDAHLMIPYASVVPGLTGKKPYTMKTFLARVRPIAQKRLEGVK